MNLKIFSSSNLANIEDFFTLAQDPPVTIPTWVYLSSMESYTTKGPPESPSHVTSLIPASFPLNK